MLEIRLQEKYVEAAPEENKHMPLMPPLTKSKKQYYGLPKTSTLKFHYDSGKVLLEDYLGYMQKFQNRKEYSRSTY